MLLRSLLRFCLIFSFVLANSQDYSELGSHDFNFNWKFKLLEITSGKDFKKYKDWTEVNLPHDWSVHFSFDKDKGEGATGYLPGGMGTYKKDFTLDSKNTTTYILFDGVYNNSDVYINDKHLGFHPYGYTPFYFDISEHLKSDEQNTIKVNIDRSRYVDSRWYTGSGIYRNVELIRKNNLHVPIWGIFVTTPSISTEEASVNIAYSVKNKYETTQKFDVHIEIYDDKGTVITEQQYQHSVLANGENSMAGTLEISKPYLWGIDAPRTYKAKISLLQNDKVIDENVVDFGVRSIKFDTEKGFFLNGENKRIKGVCLHHDGGLVGAAVPKDVWRRRLETLRAGGCNAIRISHNPASEEFLDLCDEMGFLVQDEFFDEWDNPKDKRLNMNERSVDSISRGYVEHFQEWAESDLKSTMLAHRNHPSIIQWSIGNEIEWTYPRNQDATGFFNNMSWEGDYFWEEPPYTPEKIKEKLETLPKRKYDIGVTANKLAKWTRELDTTRYIIANCILPSASHLSGYTDALDMVGYSYRRVLYDYGHKNYPDKPIMGTENVAQWHEWKAIMERPFISGTFLWTGIDYMGESNGQWPRKATPSGILNVAGFEKPSYHMMKTLWDETPHIFIATQRLDKSIFKADEKTGLPVERNKDAWKHVLWIWHNVNEYWNYNENEKVVVEAYSNCEEVELFLNDTSFGTRYLKDFEDRIYKWIVPYNDGTLKLQGKRNGKVVETQYLKTAGEPQNIVLTTDRTILTADGYSVAHIIAQLVDANGNPVKHLNKEVVFNVDGDVTVLGVDNGSSSSVQDYQSNKVTTDKGRCILILQSQRKKDKIKISATSDSLKSNALKIDIK